MIQWHRLFYYVTELTHFCGQDCVVQYFTFGGKIFPLRPCPILEVLFLGIKFCLHAKKKGKTGLCCLQDYESHMHLAYPSINILRCQKIITVPQLCLGPVSVFLNIGLYLDNCVRKGDNLCIKLYYQPEYKDQFYQ